MKRYVVNDVPVSVVAERVQYMAADGKLITESLEDYTKKNVTRQYATLNAFMNSWTKAEQKTVILEELEEQGVLFEALQELVGKDYDPFDLICHVVFGQPPRSGRRITLRSTGSRHGRCSMPSCRNIPMAGLRISRAWKCCGWTRSPRSVHRLKL